MLNNSANKKIVRVEREHLFEIEEIEKLCFADPWSFSNLEMLLDKNLWAAFACVIDGSIVGYGNMMCVAGDEGDVGNIAVHPDYRRLGIGSDIVNALIREGIDRGLSIITLDVRESNIPARRLYEKKGFVQVGYRPKFYSHPTEAGLIMSLSLKGGS